MAYSPLSAVALVAKFPVGLYVGLDASGDTIRVMAPKGHKGNERVLKQRIARQYWISGRVQGVGFRAFTERVAQELGVSGWARNLADGRVEVHANGSVVQLDEFEARLRQGPRWADVRGFEVTEVTVSDTSGFYIR